MQARKLTAKERELLAERLLFTIRDQSLTSVDEAWVAEAEGRFSAWKQGTTKTVSATTALREIRRKLRR